jgi:hypothetical protein
LRENDTTNLLERLERARRIARQLLGADRERLLAFAEELETELRSRESERSVRSDQCSCG